MSVQVDIVKRFEGFTLEMAFEADDEALGLLGASGCGKSLTLRCIAGVEEPDEGRIVVDGRMFFDRVPGKRPRVNLRARERRTALLFQSYQLFPNLRVQDNIAAGIAKDVAAGERDARVQRQLRRFGLTGLERRYPAQLSGGQQQRVALARMLASEPDILMLDEPFSALDPHLKSELEQDLLALFERFEGSVLYVSHDIDEAYRFCDRIAVVNDGRIDELGPKRQVINEPSSLAAIKLSGCKNTTQAEFVDAHTVRLPQWGVTMQVARPVPPDVKWLGVRAFLIRRLDGCEPATDAAGAADAACAADAAGASSVAESMRMPSVIAEAPNAFMMRCDRVSDARFERTAMVSFIDPETGRRLAQEDSEDESLRFFRTHVRWNIDKLQVPDSELPEVGDVVCLQFPPEALYVVNR